MQDGDLRGFLKVKHSSKNLASSHRVQTLVFCLYAVLTHVNDILERKKRWHEGLAKG